MKKTVMVLAMICMALSIYAGTFDGLTSTGLNYEYRDGKNRLF